MKKFFGLTLGAFLSITYSVTAKEIPFLKPYGELLQDYVEDATLDGIPTYKVNYKAWQKDPRHKQAMALLEKDETSAYLSKEQQLSFWINAYNLLVIDLIVREAPTESVQDLGGIVSDPWNDYAWLIDGLEYTLNDVQQQVIRPLREPRAFFALSCGAISCPNLKRTPYGQDYLYTQLEKQTLKFISNNLKAVRIEKAEEKNGIVQGKDKAFLSQLFLWHQQDLEGGNPARFIGQYIPMDNTEASDYMDFDWKLNALPNELPDPKLRNHITLGNKN